MAAAAPFSASPTLNAMYQALAAAQDTAVRLPKGMHAADTTVDMLLFGDKVTPVIQFIFQQKPWVMWAGVAVAAVLAFFILRWLWPKVPGILTWIRTRGTGGKLALGGGLAAFLAIAGLAGWKANDFMMNDRRFCNGCHIFVPSGQVLEAVDTGNYTIVNRMEGKHDTINCHTCHAFHPEKEAVKMVLWMSGVREEKIPAHGKVPRNVCEKCHVQGAAKQYWQAIARTAGHKLHLESDSSALKGKVECLTCHARSAHRFQPPDTTCAQKGCHVSGDIKIKLGRMADQADLHCNACHRFTKDLPFYASSDSAKGALVPSSRQCFSCHQMRQRLAEFDPAKDPHGGTCGMCHNPHENVKPADALKTCASAQCHSDWRKVDFHVGAAHRKVAETCETCHNVHSARVDASDCVGCHEAVKAARAKGGKRLAPPVPFDTAKAVRQQVSDAVEPWSPHGKGDVPPPEASPPAASLQRPQAEGPVAAVADSFEHAKHKKLACVNCHDVKSKVSKVTFVAPRGCFACHHQAPANDKCAQCHGPDEVKGLSHVERLVVKTTAPKAVTRTRDVTFRHEAHADAKCLDCHATPVMLGPTPKAKACEGCHDQHHAAQVGCATCHNAQTNRDAHTRAAHVECTACHARETVQRLQPDRKFCLSCHEATVDHYPAQECTQCHMLASPDAWRPRLLARP